MATSTQDSGELFGGTEPEEPDPKAAKPTAIRSLTEWIVVIVGAIAVALVIKAFVIQAFFIPTGSMIPTLLVGDRVLTNKLSYHLHDVNRGDVVVFERPASWGHEDSQDLIKRVIGLPGESVVVDGGRVYVNGTQLDEPYLPAGTTTQTPGNCTRDRPCVIPKDNIFVMGDNRGNSSDSRFNGPVPEDKVVGRAFVRVWPLDRFGGL